MSTFSQRNTRWGQEAARTLKTLYGVTREDAWRDKMNACRTALANRDAAIETAWREHAGQARERACQAAQRAYDTAIATARDEYEATTEAAWNDHDRRMVA